MYRIHYVVGSTNVRSSMWSWEFDNRNFLASHKNLFKFCSYSLEIAYFNLLENVIHVTY